MCFKETLSMTWWNTLTPTLLNRTWTLKAIHHQVTITSSCYVQGILRSRVPSFNQCKKVTLLLCCWNLIDSKMFDSEYFPQKGALYVVCKPPRPSSCNAAAAPPCWSEGTSGPSRIPVRPRPQSVQPLSLCLLPSVPPRWTACGT